MTTRSRRQTRHRTFGWYTSNPVDHNRTVAIAKARYRAKLARIDQDANDYRLTEPREYISFSTQDEAAANVAAVQELVDDLATLGMTDHDARQAINDHRQLNPHTSWEHTATVIHNLALHNALTDRNIDQ